MSVGPHIGLVAANAEARLAEVGRDFLGIIGRCRAS
jgi:hypothetical protein